MIKNLIILFVIIPVFFSCKKEKAEKTVFFNNLGVFDKIELKSVFDVYLIQDTFYSVKVVGREDMVDKVEVVNENSVIQIKNNTNLKWLKPEENKITIYISSDRPKQVRAFETCYIRTVNPIISNEFGIVVGSKLNMADLELNNNVFYFWNDHPCGGKLTLRGNTKNLRLWNFAIMTVDAVNLSADTGLVCNHSQGDCSVMINNFLDYSIFGTGNIKLYGNPSRIVQTELASSGRLIRMN